MSIALKVMREANVHNFATAPIMQCFVSSVDVHFEETI